MDLVVNKFLPIADAEQTEDDTFFYYKVALSSVDNIDSDGDKILPGGFNKFLKSKTKQIPMRYQHDRMRNLGFWKEFKQDGNLLVAKGFMVKTADVVGNVKPLVDAGAVSGISAGMVFKNVKPALDRLKDYPRLFGAPLDVKEAYPFEGSFVDAGANEQAGILKHSKTHEPITEKMWDEFVEGLEESKIKFSPAEQAIVDFLSARSD